MLEGRNQNLHLCFLNFCPQCHRSILIGCANAWVQALVGFRENIQVAKNMHHLITKQFLGLPRHLAMSGSGIHSLDCHHHWVTRPKTSGSSARQQKARAHWPLFEMQRFKSIEITSCARLMNFQARAYMMHFHVYSGAPKLSDPTQMFGHLL